MRRLLPLVFLFSACATTIPSGAQIARFETSEAGRSLRYCEPAFGWNEIDLAKTCGEPFAKLPSASPPLKNCWLYRTYARALHGAGESAPIVAVCFANRYGTRSIEEQVVLVFGMSNEATKTSSTAR